MARKYVKRTCAKCKGSGYLPPPKYAVPTTTSGIQYYGGKVCPKCGGKGSTETDMFIEE